MESNVVEGQVVDAGAREALAATVPNYLVGAILTTLCCCLPFGIVSIIFSVQANSKKAAGDIAGAIDSAKKAKLWLILGVAIGLGVQLLSVFIQIVCAVLAEANC